MRRRCLALLAAALSAAGCGGQHSTTTHARTATRTTASTSASPRDCDKLGINPTGMREGTCTHAGLTYVIVDENHPLKLRTLTATLTRIRAASSLPGTQPTVAQGKFVITSIRITNRLELPQAFDRTGTRQAELNLEGTVYPEDVGAERAGLANACVAAKTPIVPGKSETCSVLFDVASAAARHLGQHASGDLYLVDFGSDLGGSIPPQVVGQIRLYR